MANPLKRLASETAIYGLTHTLSRFINVLLVPFYTHILTKDNYGNMSVFYGAAAISLVVISAGMETAFFNFSRKNQNPKVYSTALITVIVYGAVALLLSLSLSTQIASGLGYPNQAHYVKIFAFILVLDAITSIPMAWLRNQNKALTFGKIKIINVLANIFFNVLFLVVFRLYFTKYYNPDFIIGYAFLANLLATCISLLFTLPYFRGIKEGFDLNLWKKMTAYAWPLVFVGLAGVINENMDRILLKNLLPKESADGDIGVYSAFYKLGLIITIFVQAFRYAAEPFFFKESNEKNAPKTYALVLRYFTLGCSFMFLFTAVYATQIAPILITDAAFFEHPDGFKVVPFILLGALFLGMMYNVNIWYKLTHKNRIGMYISIGGALLTIIMNLILIPIMGILGSALTTMVVYFSMFVATYLIGKKHYRVPYNMRVIGFYIVSSISLYLIYIALGGGIWLATLAFAAYCSIIYWIEKNQIARFTHWLKKRRSR